jgi:class 3 adenylate cyclase
MHTPPSENSIKTVLELDLASYSDIARVLEEHLDAHAVMAFENQIQSFVDRGLEQVRLKREDVVFGTAGDNAVLVFDDPSVMHRFAEALQQAVAAHNRARTVDSAKRRFRMGAATGPVLLLQAEKRIVGTTVARAVRLEAAAEHGQLLADVATYGSLPDSLKGFYGDEEEIRGKREERFIARRCTFTPASEPDPSRIQAGRPLPSPEPPTTAATWPGVPESGAITGVGTIEHPRPSPAARRIKSWLLLAVVVAGAVALAVVAYRLLDPNGPPEPSGAWRILTPDKITMFRGKGLGHDFADEVTRPMWEEIDQQRKEYKPDNDRVIYLSPPFAAEHCPKSISLVDGVEALLGVCVFAEAQDQLLDRVSSPNKLGRTVDIHFDHSAARGRVRLVILVFPLTPAGDKQVADADRLDRLIRIHR